MRNKIRCLAATALVFASLTQLASASFVDVPPDHKLYSKTIKFAKLHAADFFD